MIIDRHGIEWDSLYDYCQTRHRVGLVYMIIARHGIEWDSLYDY